MFVINFLHKLTVGRMCYLFTLATTYLVSIEMGVFGSSLVEKQGTANEIY